VVDSRAAGRGGIYDATGVLLEGYPHRHAHGDWSIGLEGGHKGDVIGGQYGVGQLHGEDAGIVGFTSRCQPRCPSCVRVVGLSGQTPLGLDEVVGRRGPTPAASLTRCHTVDELFLRQRDEFSSLLAIGTLDGTN